MLLVDSNKRIKLHEIRQLPWFQKDLPAYLFPALPSSSSADDGDGEGEASSPSESQVLWNPEEDRYDHKGRRREWVDGLGVVDQEIVDDLCGKIGGLTSDDVWGSLQAGQDKELRIVYKLFGDNKRMVEGCTCLAYH